MMAEAKKPFGVYVSPPSRPAKQAKPLSRYDGRPEPEAPGGIPEKGVRSAGVDVIHVNEFDPIQDAEKNRRQGKARSRIKVAANVRASILDWERHQNLIDDGQYRVGVLIENLFEIRGGGSNDSGVRLDANLRKELAIIFGIEAAQNRLAMLDGIRQIVGVVDALILRRILGDRWTYAAVAAEIDRIGKFTITQTSDRSARYAARRFRDALATLAEKWRAS